MRREIRRFLRIFDYRMHNGGKVGLEMIEAEIEEHMQKEEQVLFPMMRQGGHSMIAQPIRVLFRCPRAATSKPPADL